MLFPFLDHAGAVSSTVFGVRLWTWVPSVRIT